MWARKNTNGFLANSSLSSTHPTISPEINVCRTLTIVLWGNEDRMTRWNEREMWMAEQQNIDTRAPSLYLHSKSSIQRTKLLKHKFTEWEWDDCGEQQQICRERGVSILRGMYSSVRKITLQHKADLIHSFSFIRIHAMNGATETHTSEHWHRLVYHFRSPSCAHPPNKSMHDKDGIPC